MDALSAQTIYYTSLVADDFEDVSGGDEATADMGDTMDSELGANEPLGLMGRFVRPRFEGLLAKQAKGDDASRSLLNDMYSRLKVVSRDVNVTSSERCLTLDFAIAGMQGHYEQRSQADAASATWDLGSNGNLELVPNVSAELVLDGESLVRCEYYAAGGPTRTVVDESRLSDRFGSQTLETLGGTEVLLRFLGAVCADAGAAYYAGALPFSLPRSLLALEVDEEAAAAATALAPPPDRFPAHAPEPASQRPAPGGARSRGSSTGARPAPAPDAPVPPAAPAPASTTTLPRPSSRGPAAPTGGRAAVPPAAKAAAPRRPRGTSHGRS